MGGNHPDALFCQMKHTQLIILSMFRQRFNFSYRLFLCLDVQVFDVRQALRQFLSV